MSPAAHDQDRLLEYAYGELAPSEAKSFEAHLTSCADCTRALEDIRSVRRTMGQLPTVPAPNTGLDSLLAYAQQAARRAQAGPESRSSFWKWMLPSTGVLALVLLIVVTRQVAEETSRARTIPVESSEVKQLPMAAPAPSQVEPAEKKQEDSVRSLRAPAAAGDAKGNFAAHSDAQPKPRRESADAVASKPSSPPARKAAPAPLAKVIAPSERDDFAADAKDEARAGRLAALRKSAGSSPSSENEGGSAAANASSEVVSGVVGGVVQGEGTSRAAVSPSAYDKQPRPAPAEEIARIRNTLAKENPPRAERAKLLNRLCELLYAAQRVSEAESACEQVIREFPGSPAAVNAQELKTKNAAPQGR